LAQVIEGSGAKIAFLNVLLGYMVIGHQRVEEVQEMRGVLFQRLFFRICDVAIDPDA
jgi:hypothetical protein